MKNLKKQCESNKTSKILSVIILMIVLIFSNTNATSPGNSIYHMNSIENYKIELIRININKELYKEVDNYIQKIAPNSKVSGKEIVRVCKEYDLNIIFVLAQGLLESHFGTKGIAVKTNSVFNVGTYDDGTILYTFNDPNESIEPYAKLIKDNYLVNKELNHLIQDKGYINQNGYRYATAKKYEASLRVLMKKINEETYIDILEKLSKIDDEKLIMYFDVEKPIYTNNVLVIHK